MDSYRSTLTRLLHRFILLVIGIASISSIHADENLDSLFIEARQAAMDTSTRVIAMEMCHRALVQAPDYHDFRILLGRCYAWDGDYGQAETQLSQVLLALADYQDARNALLDVYLWSDQNEKSLELLHESIERYPEEIIYRIKLMQVLAKLQQVSDASLVADKILLMDPVNEDALAFQARIAQAEQEKARVEAVDPTPDHSSRSTIVRYAYNRLAETKTEWQFIVVEPSLDPWHWISLEHKESFSFGPVILKINHANRFKNTGTQIEIESYPTLRKGTYLYTGLGYSNSGLFPSFRMGLEVFQALPKDFEFSVGFRYLEVPEKQIPIYVSSLGKYWQSYWISAKTYISPSNSSLSKSWVLGVRKYLMNPTNFLEVFVGSGVSPDANLGGEEINFLGSRSFGFTLKYEIIPQVDLNIGLHFSNLETRTDAYRGDTGLQIAVTKNY